MHVQFRLMQRQAGPIGQGAGQVGMAAVVILPAVAEKVVGIGVAARADHVMHPAAERIELIPVQRVFGDRRKAAQMRQG